MRKGRIEWCAGARGRCLSPLGGNRHSITMKTLDTTEHDVISRCLGGDAEAFGGIVQRYQGLICSLTFSASGNVSQSEEMAQETFFIAWRRLRELRDRSRLKSWLCGIARNVIRTARRERRRDGQHTVDLEGRDLAAKGATPQEIAIQREEEVLVQRALAEIPVRYREPLVLFYREDQSIQNIAAALELSESTAKQRLSRGRRLLKAQVAQVVERTLGRTRPQDAFALGVVAMLPTLTADASAVGLGTAAAASAGKGATAGTAKGLLGTGWLAFLLTPAISLVATAFGARAAERWGARTGRSPAERRFYFRFTWTIGIITALLAIPISAISANPDLIISRPVLWALVLLGSIASQVTLVIALSFWADRRLKRIRLREGTAAGFLVGAVVVAVGAMGPVAHATP
jgi:RNA polymerase sigma factor (sigma-70 family)